MKKYVLEWLDEMISVQLNPELNDPQYLSSEETNQIKEKIANEERVMLSRLKAKVFSIRDEAASRSLVKKYHDDLILMITKNYDNLHHPLAKQSELKELHEFIGDRLHHILFLFEKELSSFLGSENLTPLTSLVLLKAEIMQRAEQMRKNLATGNHGMAPVDIVMEVIDNFTTKIDSRVSITIREASYIQDLVNDVVHINGNLSSITGCPALNELLITWNLNNKTCIRYFTVGTEMLMNSYATENEKLEFLKLERKKLDNIPERQNFVLDPDFPSVKEYCLKWLNNEIAYRKNRLEGFVPLEQEKSAKEKKQDAFKVLCSLSIDQFSLIMRGADEKKILISPSLTAIYEAVVPFMSTKKKEDISPKSARNKAYNAEMSDKEKAKWALKEISAAIDGY